jgi:hypothetical protein
VDDMIEAIRVAVADGATSEQKACGATACQAILAALGAQPGTPIAMAGVPPRSPLAGVTTEQALDLVIARLTMVAEQKQPGAKVAATPQAPLRIALVQAPAPPTRRKP